MLKRSLICSLKADLLLPKKYRSSYGTSWLRSQLQTMVSRTHFSAYPYTWL
jgi:hypothetical protein